MKRVIWLIGLAGSGKTTVANELAAMMTAEHKIALLDGDVLRSIYSNDLGFSPEDRRANITRAVDVAKRYLESYEYVIASFMTSTKECQEIVKKGLGDDVAIIYLNVPVETCRVRKEALYQKFEMEENFCKSFPESEHITLVVNNSAYPAVATASHIYARFIRPSS